MSSWEKFHLTKLPRKKNEKIKTIPREKSHVSTFRKIANSRILEGNSNILDFPGTFCLFEWGAVSFEGQTLVYIYMSSLATAMLFIVFCNLATVIMAMKLFQRRPSNAASRVDEEASNVTHIQQNRSSRKMELQFAKLSGAVAISFVGCWGLFLVSQALMILLFYNSSAITRH